MMYNTVFTFHLSLVDPMNTTRDNNLTAHPIRPQSARVTYTLWGRHEHTHVSTVCARMHTLADTHQQIHAQQLRPSNLPRRPTHPTIRVRVRVPLLSVDSLAILGTEVK